MSWLREQEMHFPHAAIEQVYPSNNMVQNGISISSPESQWGQKGPAAVLTEVVAAATLQAAWMVVGTSGAEGKWQRSQEAIITSSEWTANGQTRFNNPFCMQQLVHCRTYDR